MNVKIYQRSFFINSMLVFLIFAVFFQYSIGQYLLEKTALKADYLKSFLLGHPYHLGVFALAFISIFKGRKISRTFFLLFGLMQLGSMIYMLSQQWNKGALLFIGLFSMFYFAYYILLKEELKDPIYNPSFEKNQCEFHALYPSKVKVGFKSGEIIGGLFTYVGPHSAFIILSDSDYKYQDLRIKLEVSFEKKVFQIDAVIITRYGQGVGVKILDKKAVKGGEKQNPNLWKHFYQIVMDRGYKNVV